MLTSMKAAIQFLFCIALVMGLGTPAHAQSNATNAAIEGWVTDAQGASVPNAKVVARNVATNVQDSATTDGEGYFRFPLVRIGEYEVVVTVDGFKEFHQTGVQLTVGQTARVDSQLQIGAVGESVTVSADLIPALVESASQAGAGETLSRGEVENLPIVSRNIYNFHLLSPGVKGLPSTGFGTTQFTFGGTSRSTWTVDGLDNTQRANNRQIRMVIATPEAVEEMQVLASGYSAEFGRAAGGQVNVILKSGTNALHGSALFLMRPRTWQARPSLAAVNPERTFYDGAATLGGAIKKDRIFFFSQYENNPYTLPTAITITAANAAALNLPPDQLGNAPFGETFHTYVGKIDHRIGDKNTGYIRYSRFTNEQPYSGGGLSIPARGTNFLDLMNGGGAQLATTFTPTLLNEFRFGINRRDVTRNPINGIPATAAGIDITGVANFGSIPVAGSVQIEQSAQLIDNITWTRSRHTLKAGFDFQHTAFDLVNALDRRFVFGGLSASNGRPAVSALNQYLNTLQSVSDPATGKPYTYTQYLFSGGQNALDMGFNFVNFFIQDEFRLAQNFTLNLGLRYEQQLTPTLDQAAPFALSQRVSNDKNNFAPRFGFSWSPFSNRKTVVRGSYGIYYDTPGLNIFTNAALINGHRLLSYQVNGADPLAPVFPNAAPLTDPKFAVAPNITAFTPDFQIMYQQQANLIVQRELVGGAAISMQYSYANTRQGPYLRDINLGAPVSTLADGRPVFGGNAARPDTRFRQINLIESGSNSNYHALDVTLRKRFAKGVSFGANWGWGHALSDNLQEGTALSDPTNRQRDYGSRESDVRHSVTVQAVYAPQFGGRLVKGFELSTMTYYNSGYPINATAGADLNNDGVLNDRPLFRGRNDVGGPSLVQLDLRLSRNFLLRDRYQLAALIETENTLNSTNPNCSITSGCTGAVVNNATAADFGRVTSARSARNVQFGFRFRF